MAYDAAHETLEVVHHIPGRLRVRVPAAGDAEGLSEAVAALPGVTSATWSPLTRGLLVLYDRERADEAAIVGAIADHTQVDVTPPAAASSNGGRPTVAGAVSSVFSAVNARVAGTTGGVLTLGVLVPAVLTLWATREILIGRAAPLRWSSALWYAHSLFRDYALPHRES
jgi:Heavy metal associated domain 2